MVLCRFNDVRGWGAIQNLFKNKDGSIRIDETQEFQDKMGVFLAKAIDESLNKVYLPTDAISFGNYLCENYIPFEDKKYFWIDTLDELEENPITFTTSDLYKKYIDKSYDIKKKS